ncbi:hypothetical protein [Streptomyces sp. NPDC058486]|uniref:hypothetical protein n=1 Tax=unclassified Streptomyces TaxID=2593676 RepID=UPI00365E127D
MGAVIMHSVVSVDGFIADKNDGVGDYDHTDGAGGFKLSRASAAYGQPVWDSIGVIVMGRHQFDLVKGWEDRPPAGEHVVLAAGLIDEVAMDVVPVVFGSGKRFFGSFDGQQLLGDPPVVIQGNRVVHLKFKVCRQE